MSDQPRRGPSSPVSSAWSSNVWLSPTKLKQYQGCPQRVRLQYVDKVKAYAPYSLFLEEGKIAHNMLGDAAKRLKAKSPLRNENDLLRWAFEGMRADEFPSDDAHLASARKIVRWYQAGMAHLDREATFINIEGNGHRDFPLPSSPGVRLTIASRPDLIMLRTDADGQPFVDIVDYKTGQVWVDPIPPVSMRFIFKTLFQELAEDTLSLPMQFSYVFLEHGETEIIPLTPEYCAEVWSEVLQVAEQMVTEREWPATPSHMCHYCPYHGRQCDAEIPREDDWE